MQAAQSHRFLFDLSPMVWELFIREGEGLAFDPAQACCASSVPRIPMPPHRRPIAAPRPDHRAVMLLDNN